MAERIKAKEKPRPEAKKYLWILFETLTFRMKTNQWIA